jgi:hypothetical protein
MVLVLAMRSLLIAVIIPMAFMAVLFVTLSIIIFVFVAVFILTAPVSMTSSWARTTLVLSASIAMAKIRNHPLDFMSSLPRFTLRCNSGFRKKSGYLT